MKKKSEKRYNWTDWIIHLSALKKKEIENHTDRLQAKSPFEGEGAKKVQKKGVEAGKKKKEEEVTR